MLKESAIQVLKRERNIEFDPETMVAYPVDNLNMKWGIFSKNDMNYYFLIDNSGLFVHTYKLQTDLAVSKNLYKEFETPFHVVNDDDNYYIYLISKWSGFNDKVSVQAFSKTTYKKVSKKGMKRFQKSYTDKKGTYVIKGRKKIYFDLNV